MYHSVTFGSMNSFSDWHLVPDGRPVIAMPEPKIVTVDIPGRNGILDLSESIRKFPVYSNRSGSLKFHVLNDKGIGWQELYRQIANYVHGRRMNVYLEDEPEWYYTGRVNVASWTSNNDGTWSDIEFNYDLEPFKYYYHTTINDGWLWDPFNFFSGYIIGNRLKDIKVNSTSYTKLDLTDLVGRMPLNPKFVVTSSTGVDFRIYNKELGLDITKTKLTSGTHEWPEVILSEVNYGNEIYIQYKASYSSGIGSSFSLDYRVGSL